jgi:cellulase
MRSTLFAGVIASTLTGLVSAHGYVSGIKVNGGSVIAGANPNWYYLPADQIPVTPGWKALNQDNGFVEPNSFGSSDIACHKSAKPGQAYVSAQAGDTLTLIWNTWPDSHKGPVINYIAPCSGECTSASPGSLSFAKISQAALLSGSNPGTWATDTLIAQGFSSDVKLPSSLAPGNYVLRHEIIALHAAGSANGAQAYPQCINVKITSGGSAKPSGEAATAFYKANDPGILFNLYGSFSSYPIPGPSVWSG